MFTFSKHVFLREYSLASTPFNKNLNTMHINIIYFKLAELLASPGKTFLYLAPFSGVYCPELVISFIEIVI